MRIIRILQTAEIQPVETETTSIVAVPAVMLPIASPIMAEQSEPETDELSVPDESAVEAVAVSEEIVEETAVESEAVSEETIEESVAEPISVFEKPTEDILVEAVDVSISEETAEESTVELAEVSEKTSEPVIIPEEIAEESVIEPVVIPEEIVEESAVETTEAPEEAVVEEKFGSTVAMWDSIDEEFDDILSGYGKGKKKPAKKADKKDFVPPQPQPKPKPKKSAVSTSVIHQHFEQKGYVVVESHTPVFIEGLKSLAFNIGDNYTHAANFLKEIKKAICSPNCKSFERRMKYRFGNNTEGNKFVRRLAHDFCKYGIFTEFAESSSEISATIADVPRVTSFLTGYWLEIYSASIVQETVKNFAEKHGYSYEVLMNVKLVNAMSANRTYAHELDAVFSVANKCFAFEAKSGTVDYQVLYNTRKELSFVPEQYILLTAGITDRMQIEMLSYFYEYYISSLADFRNNLTKMINKSFNI
ncbi:MAG: hypothetical protein NC340_10250 [Ruminococcus flavefaciens]|nr:hypothetical protein [Ruminococcus flavefaciens]MCM1229840.1 hypothetical protein [Ruminococcus flavefaciens]